MANYTAIDPTQRSDFSLTPDIIPQIWDYHAQEGVRQKDWLSQFEGEGGDKPIQSGQDKLKKAGDTVVYTTEGELVGEAVQGDTAAVGTEEGETYNTYTCVVDYQRHAVARTRRFVGQMAAAGKSSLVEKLTGWLGRLRQHHAALKIVKDCRFTSGGQSKNLIYSGGGSAEASLTANNVLSTNLLQQMRSKLIGLGAKPANLSMEEGQEIPEYVGWGTQRVLAGLDNDAQWNQANLNARGRESGRDAKNPLFNGSFGVYKGIRLFEFPVPDHDNPAKGAIGFPFEPRALLRTALTGTGTTTIDGGGSSGLAGGAATKPYYFKDFPGYDYLFTSGQSSAADAGTYYLAIYNLPGSANAGKREIISYVGSNNNGNTITSVTRGVNAADSDYHSDHDANSLIVPVTSNGVPYAFFPVLGRMGLIRAYGEFKEQMDFENQDYGHVRGACISSVFGQNTAKRVDGTIRNIVLAQVAIDPLA